MSAVVPALVAGACCCWLARPLSVVAAALPFRVPWREQAFLSWSGLRGAVPIVLALIALTEGAPGATALVDVVFVLVVVLTLLQGTTLPWVARLLGVARAGEPREIEVDAAPLDELGADLLQVRVPVGSRLKGVYLRELRLPAGRRVSLVVRDERGVHPDAGDPAARTRPAARRHHRARAGARPRTGSGPSTCAAGWPAWSATRRPGVGYRHRWTGERPTRRRPRRRVSHREPRPAARCPSRSAVLVADIITKTIAVAQLEGGAGPHPRRPGLPAAAAQPRRGVLDGHRLHLDAHGGRDRGGRS